MASVTKHNDETSEVDDDAADEAEVARESGKALAKSSKGEAPQRKAIARPAGEGFFTIYKKGHGYWTRVGTVIGVALVGVLTAYSIYAYTPIFLPERIEHKTAVKIALGVALGFAAAYSLIAWHLMNKPANVEFLIATDSEMKKVNWTSRRELIGSTKVVCAFMALTALFLFVCDIFFSELFKFIHVLKFGYFGS